MKCNLVYWMQESSVRLKGLRFTLCNERDMDVLNKSGLAELRRMRMARLIDEAKRQGVRLTYRDLSLILLTSRSTLKRDMKA